MAAVAAPNASAYQDLRSPDVRDAALAAHAQTYRDLRSPDARDPGRVEPTPSPSADSTGTDWSDVRIVAAGAAGLLIIGLGGVVLYTRRTRRLRKSRTPVASR